MWIKGLAAVLSLGLVLAGCGGDVETDAQAGAPAGEAGAGAAAAGGDLGAGDAGGGAQAGVAAAGAGGGSDVAGTGGAAGAGTAGSGAGETGRNPGAQAGGAQSRGGAGASGQAGGAQAGAGGAQSTGSAGSGDQATGAMQAGAATPRQQQAILRATAERYETIRSMQAQFEMRYENRLLRSNVTSRGTLYQRRPDRILLDFSEPEGDVLLGDGTYFWAYYPSVDRGQAVRTPQARGSGGVDLQAQFVGDPVERFEYTYDGVVEVNGRSTHAFTLTPREPTDYTQLKVWIDAEDSLVRQFEFTDNTGAVRRIQLTGLQLNPSFDDARFRFVPPQGVRVVDRG